MNKSIFCLLLFIWLSKMVFAQGTTLSISNVNGTPENPVTIPVQVTNISDMTGFQFTITYDKTFLTYVNCSNWRGGTNASAVQINSLDGKLTFVYNDAAVNIISGKFFDLNFTVNANVSGVTPINWSDSPTVKELSNSIPEIISCSYNNGSVKISTCISPAAPTVGTIIQPTCAVATGSVTLSGLPASGTWTLIRTPGDTTTTDTGTNYTVSGLAAGTYTYSVTNAAGCKSVESSNILISSINNTPVLSVLPASRNVTSLAGNTTFDISNTGCGTMNWTVSDDADWLTVSPTTGLNNDTIIATFEANSGCSSRTATITITATGATGSPKTVTVVQEGNETPVLSVLPASRNVASLAGNTTFDISNTGCGTMNWTVSDDADWLTVSPTTGLNNDTIIATFEANTECSLRTVTITITATGATGSPKTVTVVQEGNETPVLSVLPASRNVASLAGNTTFDISNTGCGTMNWTVSDDADWLTVSPTTGLNNDTIIATFEANTECSLRTATITITATGATGSPKTVTVVQEGNGTPVLSVLPASHNVTSLAGNTTFDISNTGCGTMNLSVTVDATWLTVSLPSGSNNVKLSAMYEANTGCSSRTATITITATGATGSPKTVTVVQEGNGIPILSVTYPIQIQIAGQKIYNISNIGCGVLIWNVTSPSWLTVSPKSGTGNGSITIYDPPKSCSTLYGEIIINSNGGTYKIAIDIPGNNTPVLSVAPLSRSVSAIAGNTTFDISNTGCGTLNLSISDDAAWLTVTPTSGSNNGTITATYEANTGCNSRTATITITATGATGSPKTVTVVQEGNRTPVLSVLPASRNVTSPAGNTTFDISNTGCDTMKWTVSYDADWLTVSPTSGLNNDTITATYKANNTTTRKVDITVTVNGTPMKVTITQTGTTAVSASSFDDNQQIKVYPNPFNNFINIENHDKVARLQITNVLGQTVLDSENPQHFTNTEKLNDGIYFITLFGKKGVLKWLKMIKNSN